MKKAFLLMGALAVFGVGCEERTSDRSILEKAESAPEELREDVDNAAKDVEDKVEDETDRK